LAARLFLNVLKNSLEEPRKIEEGGEKKCKVPGMNIKS